MSMVQNFNFAGHQVRAEVSHSGEPWFVASDIAKILGHGDSTSMTRRLDNEDQAIRAVSTSSGAQEVAVISESGLFAAILDSQKDVAKEVKRWIAREVLPVIRHAGSRGPSKAPDLSSLGMDGLEYLAGIGRALEAAVVSAKVNQRKADAYDQFLNGAGYYKIGTAAKMLGVRDLVFWDFLYSERFLIKGGPKHRQPYANPRTSAWFAVKTYDQERTNGHAAVVTLLSPAGLEELRRIAIHRGLISDQETLFPVSQGFQIGSLAA